MNDDTPTAPTEDRTDATDPEVEDAPEADGTDVADRLRDHAVRLESADPAADVADLAPLEELLCDARVVGLGEATHGTREFFELKHRILRYLVTECGARTFALEANLPEARALDRYVVHGEGDPREALEAVYFWTWSVESVLDLLEWLRRFNADRPEADRVRFYGFDAQYTQGAVECLREYLGEVDPGFLATVEDDLEAAADEGTPPHQDDRRDDRIDAGERVVAAVGDRLRERREAYVDATSERAWDRANRDCRVVEQATAYKRAIDALQADGGREATERSLAVRDRAMADNVDWILERDGAPVVVWGHDAHLNRVEHRVRDGDAAATSMGGHLAERHGAAYVALGFAFGSGSFQAIGEVESEDGETEYALQEWSLDGPLVNTLESTLADLDSPVSVVDLRSASEDDRLEEWLSTPRDHFSVGATYDPGDPEAYRTAYAYADAFDAVCYVDETTRARPLED